MVSSLTDENRDFISRYLELFIEEINFFVRSNNLEWILKEKGGKAFIIVNRTPTPTAEKAEESPSETSSTPYKGAVEED